MMADKKHIRTFRSKKLHPEHVKLINEAIRKNARGGDHNVHISYTKADGTKSDRKVKPLAVKGKSLFVAHCHERNAIRSFKVERIDMIKKAFWDGFEKQAKGGFTRDQLLRQKNEDRAVSGKPLTRSFVNSVLKNVDDPVRKKDLRSIAKRNPVWFQEYREMSDRE